MYGPYGQQRYSQGAIGTPKGFTGQDNDSLTGLDYYNARYYDPVAGVFLSADTVVGNGSGENPYAYVDGNPETFSDPTGHFIVNEGDTATLDGAGPGQDTGTGGGGDTGASNGTSPSVSSGTSDPSDTFTWSTTSGNTVTQYQIDPDTGDMNYWVYRNGALVAGGDMPDSGGSPTAVNGAVLAQLGIKFHFPDTAGGISISVAPQPLPSTQTGSGGRGGIPPIVVSSAPAPCSFTSDTPVTTGHGKEAIGKLQVGDKVLAYNPKTHKMEQEPILHVWTHTDSDLVDVTISYRTLAQHGKGVIQKSDVLHTTSEHPFMTTEHGFMPAGNLKIGMHVLRADGSVGVITGWKVVHGAKTMYNLEVAQDHTFTVGDGQWVVHNECGSGPLRKAMDPNGTLFKTGQEAHHVIPCSVYNQGHALLTQAGDLFDPNAASNGRALYNSRYAIDAMNEAQPYHTNSPEYAARVRSMMDAEFQRLQSNGLTGPQDAFDSLMGTIDQLNQWMNMIGTLSFLYGTPCAVY